MHKKSKLCPESGLQGIQQLRIKKCFMCIINNPLTFDNNIIVVFSLKVKCTGSEPAGTNALSRETNPDRLMQIKSTEHADFIVVY
jgi:hypothetical protein